MAISKNRCGILTKCPTMQIYVSASISLMSSRPLVDCCVTGSGRSQLISIWPICSEVTAFGRLLPHSLSPILVNLSVSDQYVVRSRPLADCLCHGPWPILANQYMTKMPRHGLWSIVSYSVESPSFGLSPKPSVHIQLVLT